MSVKSNPRFLSLVALLSYDRSTVRHLLCWPRSLHILSTHSAQASFSDSYGWSIQSSHGRVLAGLFSSETLEWGSPVRVIATCSRFRQSWFLPVPPVGRAAFGTIPPTRGRDQLLHSPEMIPVPVDCWTIPSTKLGSTPAPKNALRGGA